MKFQSKPKGIFLILLVIVFSCSPVTNDHTPNGEEKGLTADGAIVFVSDMERVGDNYDMEIFVMNTNGVILKRLTVSEGEDREPKWSPDGNKIVFVSLRDGSLGEIYVMNADGTNLSRLTSNSFDDIQPSWSPDGTKIIYSSSPDKVDYDIYTISVNGGIPIQITNDPANEYWPSFSPDGKKIVYVSTKDGNKEIYMMSLDKPGESIRLTNNESDEENPVFSKDGKRIIFASDRGQKGVFSIYSMDIEGKEATLLTINDFDKGFVAKKPSISPDGEKIVYVSNGSKICRIDLKGTGEKMLSPENADYFDDDPNWGLPPLYTKRSK